MKKFGVIGIVCLLFTGCWIHEIPTNYDKVDDTYYFYDYDAMVSVIVPLINDTFSDWHYSKTKFEQRYKSYFNNIEKNEDSYNYLNNSNYNYAVKYANSNSEVVIKKGDRKYKIKGYYYWITDKKGNGTIFFKDYVLVPSSAENSDD